MSGRLPLHVAQIQHADWCDTDQGVPKEMTFISKKMKQGGYSTHAIGKVMIFG